MPTLIKTDRITCRYRNYEIKPKRDFGKLGFWIKGRWVKKGYVVTDGMCNVMPGACWFQTLREAKDAIDVLHFTKGNTEHFWEIIQNPLEGYVVGQRAPGASGILIEVCGDLEQTMTCGRFFAITVRGIVKRMGINSIKPWDGKPMRNRPHYTPRKRD